MSADIEQPTEEPIAPVEEPAQEQPAEEAVAERDVEQDTLDIPDSTQPDGKARYVPLSAVEGARSQLAKVKAELEEAKAGSAKAQQLEARIDELSNHLAQLAPKAQAYDAAVAANQQRPAQDDPAERAELEEIARDYDFYKADGSLDLAKAQRHQDRVQRTAEKMARQHVEPLAAHTVRQASNVMLARAKATHAPNGAKPDPKMLDQIWARLDPRLTATVEGATQAWNSALGLTAAMAEAGDAKPAGTRNERGQFTTKAKDDIPPPLHTERAGGKDTPDVVALNDQERKYLKDAGITEKEYLESANGAAWLRR